MIRIEHLTLGYGGRNLLENVSAAIPAGSLTALLGRNGTGKSTLLRALAGLGERRGGRVRLDGTELDGIAPQRLAETVAFVATERVRIANLRCRDVVALGRAPYTNWIGRMQPGDTAVVTRALASVGMSDYADRTMERMSDGECQRVMIARALAQETPIILLDEPTSFLDLPNRYELCSLLAHLAHDEGKCILFSTHELDIALTLCDSVALIDPPQLYHLPTTEMIRSGHIERLFSNDTVRFDAATGTISISREQSSLHELPSKKWKKEIQR
ncbi:ABC transporter ATP-binding protein [uncultured Alistipes sp.]|uniref:ABC transporter ATP-binding protein n=1 Tax=uncultured Alistipes sp. TaxID=538949 RepID=UPI0032B2179D